MSWVRSDKTVESSSGEGVLWAGPCRPRGPWAYPKSHEEVLKGVM